MNQIKNIIQKEFRSFFNSAIGYVFLIVFLMFSGWMFFRTFFLFGQVNMRGFFAFLPWTFLFLIPAFTMRSWAEEFRSGTVETLLTNSVSLWKVIIAKFLSVMLFLGLALILTIPFAITISMLGNLDWGIVIISYIGAFFLGGAYASIGLFISAITKNQIVAFILALLTCFFFFIIGENFVTMFVPEFLGNMFHFLGLGTHFNSMMRGVLDSRDIFFYLSFIIIFIGFNILILSHKFWPKQKFWKGIVGGLVLFTFLINIGGNFVFARFDGTENKNYTLSLSSENILRNIQHPVVIKAFISSNIPAQMQSISQDIKDILSEYESQSGENISLEILDPLKDDTAKEWANNFGIVPLQLQVIEKDQQQVLKAYLGVSVVREDVSKEKFTERFDKYETIPVITKMNDFEYQLTSAVKKVALEELPIVGVLTDHNTKKLGNFEISPYADPKIIKDEVPLLDLLEKSYEIKNISLSDETFDEDIKKIKTILILGPTENFSDEESQKIKDLVHTGKNIIFLADKMNVIGNSFAQNSETDFKNILDEFGIEIETNLVADLSNETVGMSNGIFQIARPYPFLVKSVDLDKSSSITKDLPSLSFPWISSLKLTEKNNYKINVLAKTSPYFIIKEGKKLTQVPIDSEVKNNLDENNEAIKDESNTKLKDADHHEEQDEVIKDESNTKLKDVDHHEEQDEVIKDESNTKLKDADHHEEQDEVIKDESNTNPDDADQDKTTPPPVKTKEVLVDTTIPLTPDQDFRFTKEKKDPLPLAVIVQQEDQGTILFIANSRFVTREFAQNSSTNLLFLNNAVDMLTIGDDLISIRSKQIIDRPIKIISDIQKEFIRWGNILVMSFLIVIYGIMRRYWRRKQKQLLI